MAKTKHKKVTKLKKDKVLKFNFKCSGCNRYASIEQVISGAEVLHKVTSITEIDCGGYSEYEPALSYDGWEAASSGDNWHYQCILCGDRIGKSMEDVVNVLRDKGMLEEE
jgi:hypothetical protein